ncbi:protein BUD31 homolog [Hylaeus volcanicus]|uniref:protein BUD31 homolog n=1 Tax=Hylaeus volcanicus TaxID=313075 RepID=UPI0023B7F20E|nr:protein BUD31 homolog [Hylaeus volcanicus]
MYRTHSFKNKKIPEGWDLIEETVEDFKKKMRDAELEPHEGKRKCESLWPIFRIHHQRSRYIYDMYFIKQSISKELYDYCCQAGYADRNLIGKWRKQGFEKLCCLKCIQPSNSNFGTTCICRVPSKDLEKGKVVECTHCGCRGCASSD